MPESASPAPVVVTIPSTPGATHGFASSAKTDEPSPSAPPAGGESSKTPAPAPAEATSTEKKPEAHGDKTYSTKLNELAKRERGILAAHKKLGQDREAFKVEQAKNLAAVEAERAKVAADIKSAQDWLKTKADAKRNPDPVAKLLWGDNWYEALTQYKAAGGTPPAELLAAAVDEKLEAFRAEQTRATEEARKSAEQKSADDAKRALEAKTAQEEKDIAEWTKGVAKFVTDNAPKYELVTATGQGFLVPQLIRAWYDKTGDLLTPEQAADRVEESLAKQAETMAAAKKMQARLQQATQQAQPAQDAKPQPTKTLSNDMRASAPSDTRPPPQDDAERLRRAAAKWAEAERTKR